MSCFAARATKTTIPISALPAKGFSKWVKAQPKRVGRWVKACGFEPGDGKVLLVPDTDGNIDRVLLGLGDGGSMWSFSSLPGALPQGTYAVDDAPKGMADAAALGWALAHYAFDRYKPAPAGRPTLVWPEGSDRDRVTSQVDAIYLGRDLINTPAGDLGPAELAAAVRKVGKQFGAKVSVIVGAKLLEKNYPAIHAVGRAAGAGREPRLIDLTWGKPKAPKLTLVGKGVVFDSGGLDIKPSSGMLLMKKDMGGAASVLGLARMIMAAKLPVRLRLLIPAVENAISGNAYRPGDVVSTRKGLTVEIGNTDAEGRVVLCDALAEAASESPDLIVDMATLTGAARVAMGTEVPAVFCNDDEIAAAVTAGGDDSAEPDPLWRLPLYAPYRRFLDSPIADINNIAGTRFGGAIHAALYLREFVGDTPWVHIDTMAYNDNPTAGRPKGGDVPAIRALFNALSKRYS